MTYRIVNQPDVSYASLEQFDLMSNALKAWLFEHQDVPENTIVNPHHAKLQERYYYHVLSTSAYNNAIFQGLGRPLLHKVGAFGNCYYESLFVALRLTPNYLLKYRTPWEIRDAVVTYIWKYKDKVVSGMTVTMLEQFRIDNYALPESEETVKQEFQDMYGSHDSAKHRQSGNWQEPLCVIASINVLKIKLFIHQDSMCTACRDRTTPERACKHTWIDSHTDSCPNRPNHDHTKVFLMKDMAHYWPVTFLKEK